MKTFGVAAPARLVALVVALVLGISGCRLMALSTQPATQQVSLPRAKPSLLEVLTDGGSPSVLAVMRALITATIRGGERILILDDRSGAVLASSTAPAPPSPPQPLRGRSSRAVARSRDHLPEVPLPARDGTVPGQIAERPRRNP